MDRRSALFIDVDGTLLDIAPRPELVQVPGQLPALLGCLEEAHGGALALVSGRPLTDIDRLFRPWRGAAAGLHGAERRRSDGSVAASPDDPAASAALAELRPELTRLTLDLPGVRLEDKGRTLALHYRDAPERAVEIGEIAAALTRGCGGTVRLVPGKMVVEFVPADCNKGGAIAAFLAETPFLGRTPVFLGDDTSDEDGFAEVNRRGGLSIRVGEPLPASAATCLLPSVVAARDWLAGTGNRR